MENKMNLVVTINHQLISTVHSGLFLFFDSIEYNTLKGVSDLKSQLPFGYF